MTNRQICYKNTLFYSLNSVLKHKNHVKKSWKLLYITSKQMGEILIFANSAELHLKHILTYFKKFFN